MPSREADSRDRGGRAIPAPPFSLRTRFRRAAVLALLLLLSSCRAAPVPAPAPKAAPRPAALSEKLLDLVERRTFDYFWELANPANGLVPDRAPTKSFSSIAAVGFGLTAYPIGVERGYVTREAARDRVLTTLRFFAAAPTGPEPAGRTGHRGFFYHFLDMQTGLRWETVELSTIDTTLLLAGVLFSESYFDRSDPREEEIRRLAENLYRQADWQWARARPPLVSHGWTPEEGFNSYDWRGYDESMILYVLALGSPTHAVEPEAWTEFTLTYRWEDFEGQQCVGFAPLFGHQYSHVWIDFRGIRDAYMKGKGIDYFENSRRATYVQRSYAIRNPDGWKGYGENVWGLSACDGPLDGTLVIAGRPRRFFSYAARGVSKKEIRDDGTLAPTAALASLPFAPEIVLPALAEIHRRFGAHLFSRYGFLDAFNPTLDFEVPVQHGRIEKGAGWFDVDYLGIDQGPIVAMIENYRTELVWKTMRENPHIVRGLKRAGFTGGWLDSAAN
ncbi:MAG TPA: glucoamylase family protein [Thermoanaerobaculia bacterium]